MHKGYKCLHVPSNRVYISRDGVFDEGHFPFATKPNSSPTPVPEHVLLPTLHATVPPDQHVVRIVLPLCLMVLTLAKPDSTLLLHMCRNRLLITVFPHHGTPRGCAGPATGPGSYFGACFSGAGSRTAGGLTTI
jgi:hypothetical protein